MTRPCSIKKKKKPVTPWGGGFVPTDVSGTVVRPCPIISYIHIIFASSGEGYVCILTRRTYMERTSDDQAWYVSYYLLYSQ